MQMINGIPRRARLDLHTPAELAIRAAVDAVEAAGAHPLLTDAVNLLSQAREKVADFVEGVPASCAASPYDVARCQKCGHEAPHHYTGCSEAR